MYREIRKMLLILKNRQPYNPEIAGYIAEMNRMDWISSCVRLSGEDLSREGVQKILKGELLGNVSLQTHQLIHRYVELLRQMESMLEMGTSLTERQLLQFYCMLCSPKEELEPDGQKTYYRRNNPVIVEWKYNPPHFYEIREQMDLLFRWLFQQQDQSGQGENPILRAAALHNRLAELYPFGEDSLIMARAAMLYELMSAGIPPFGLKISEQEYNRGIVLYLKKEDSSPLYETLLSGIYHQLELMLQLTAIK